VATLRSPEGSRVHTQLNHGGPTIDPVTVENLCHRPRVSQRGVPDDDAGARLPSFRRLVARENHDASA
jgi:hypothetical protein